MAGVAADRVQDLLQALGHGAQRLLDLVEHQRLVRRQAVRFQAAAQQIVGADQQVLDVVGIGAGHDADAGVHLRFQLQRLPLGRLRRQALFEQLAFRLGVTSLDLEQQALGLIFLLARQQSLTFLVAFVSLHDHHPRQAEDGAGHGQGAELA